jgi:nucleoside-diphosphate-sugar epimerase
MRVLVTGASGFVGRALLDRMSKQAELKPLGAIRRPIGSPVSGVDYLPVGDIGPDTDWKTILTGIDVVVHTAARVHAMGATSDDELPAYRRVNVAGTLNLARQARQAGVRRLVFISTIKVNGEETLPGKPFRADDQPAPVDPYAISKYEAENGLFELAASSDVEIAVIRPPLVYGPGVKANFLSMMRWVHKGVPLPLASIDNRRSFVALENLVELVLNCCSNAAAVNQVFLVSDGENVSIAELLRRIGVALGTRARLFPVPATVLKGAMTILGKRDLARRLLGSLEVDHTQTSSRLDWSPAVGMDEALARTARHFVQDLS